MADGAHFKNHFLATTQRQTLRLRRTLESIIARKKARVTPFTACSHLLTFVADTCRRQKLFSMTCQSKHAVVVCLARAIGGWAWLTSVTLAMIGRPSTVLAYNSTRCCRQCRQM